MGQGRSALRPWGRPHHAKQCQEKRPKGQLQAKQHGGDGSNGKAHDLAAGKRPEILRAPLRDREKAKPEPEKQ